MTRDNDEAAPHGNQPLFADVAFAIVPSNQLSEQERRKVSYSNSYCHIIIARMIAEADTCKSLRKLSQVKVLNIFHYIPRQANPLMFAAIHI